MSRTRYIYILSQRYSGSTLLSFLLGTHPDIATIGERRKFYTYCFEQGENPGQPCSCGQPFQQCEHWTTIKKAVEQQLDVSTYTSNPTEFKLAGNKHLHQLKYLWLRSRALKGQPLPFAKTLQKNARFNQVVVEAAMQLDNGTAFLDSSKSIDHVLFLSQIKAFDLQVIWLTRDPRAQVNSSLKYNSWDAATATRRWKEEMVLNEAILKALNINHTVLTYEQLCRDPQAEMTRLLEFVQLDPTKFSLDFRGQEQHIMGNYSMRAGTDTKIVERREWETELSANQIAEIERIAADYRHFFTEKE